MHFLHRPVCRNQRCDLGHCRSEAAGILLGDEQRHIQACGRLDQNPALSMTVWLAAMLGASRA